MSDSLCANHPDRPATGVCERCGSFGCAECLSLVGVLRLCGACRAREASALPSLSTRARLAMPFVWGTSALGLGVSLLSFGLAADDASATPRVIALGCFGLLYLLVFIAAVVMFCRWFHLLVRHAKAGGTPLDVTPAGAVGSFFIPFLNLVRPYATAKQIASTEAGVKAVGAWQALWIVANIITNVGSRMEGKAGVAGDVVGLVGALLFLGAAWACGQVVRELTASTELTPAAASASSLAAPAAPSGP
ncbi:MAG: DUF4328 domain-containing protein [Myxococcales bacterium]|nr:DUF4328 domain-containing protein [Myxococcales bacterium]